MNFFGMTNYFPAPSFSATFLYSQSLSSAGIDPVASAVSLQSEGECQGIAFPLKSDSVFDLKAFTGHEPVWENLQQGLGDLYPNFALFFGDQNNFRDTIFHARNTKEFSPQIQYLRAAMSPIEPTGIRKKLSRELQQVNFRRSLIQKQLDFFEKHGWPALVASGFKQSWFDRMRELQFEEGRCLRVLYELRKARIIELASERGNDWHSQIISYLNDEIIHRFEQHKEVGYRVKHVGLMDNPKQYKNESLSEAYQERLRGFFVDEWKTVLSLCRSEDQKKRVVFTVGHLQSLVHMVFVVLELKKILQEQSEDSNQVKVFLSRIQEQLLIADLRYLWLDEDGNISNSAKLQPILTGKKVIARRRGPDIKKAMSQAVSSQEKSKADYIRDWQESVACLDVFLEAKDDDLTKILQGRLRRINTSKKKQKLLAVLIESDISADFKDWVVQTFSSIPVKFQNAYLDFCLGILNELQVASKEESDLKDVIRDAPVPVNSGQQILDDGVDQAVVVPISPALEVGVDLKQAMSIFEQAFSTAEESGRVVSARYKAAVFAALARLNATEWQGVVKFKHHIGIAKLGLFLTNPSLVFEIEEIWEIKESGRDIQGEVSTRLEDVLFFMFSSIETMLSTNDQRKIFMKWFDPSSKQDTSFVNPMYRGATSEIVQYSYMSALILEMAFVAHQRRQGFSSIIWSPESVHKVREKVLGSVYFRPDYVYRNSAGHLVLGEVTATLDDRPYHLSHRSLEQKVQQLQRYADKLAKVERLDGLELVIFASKLDHDVKDLFQRSLSHQPFVIRLLDRRTFQDRVVPIVSAHHLPWQEPYLNAG